MFYHRFTFLSTCLRFYEKAKRPEGVRFAPIKELWDLFISNCQKYYAPSSKCTVDEQLLGFRGRCPFRTYIKSKPDKYGLKIVTLNNAATSYLINGIPYLGKTTVSVRDKSICECFFRSVTTPIHGSGRTVTCDNWFTTIPLVLRMLQPEFHLTITGTVCKNKREIPKEMKVATKDPPNSRLCFTKDMTLVSYSPKKNKLVLLVFSYVSTSDTADGKPNTVLHYNETKGGTDCFDQLCHAYTLTRRTLRWPVRFFFGILDQAAVNSWILLNCKKLKECIKPITAIDCLQSLHIHLVTSHLQESYANSVIRKDILIGIGSILGKDRFSKERREKRHLVKRKRFSMCSRKEDNKTQEAYSCNRPVSKADSQINIFFGAALLQSFLS